ncbi:MAG: MFS transporter [Flavobacteriales bacterium]|nr:MFS transporter [Flavobacteriia bacterium]NCP05999.1 MFS transporter [Flavobacteriales bacterium]PIV92762.1 MAG: MFS transporter [Flavobacteriaceae bacterium CG17_big_fil_post_rev_8_21_14_2_50_33_15]PIY10237.1 MAG: MFS transporter [Flavobacteriaceae bacterium CG_4_10_14_3_um_filter_33_47]PJB18872.1 MAG: MFS transporter [Flavobacteriaceae bacterium CG_4_9_14_3_um_filter_33_16]
MKPPKRILPIIVISQFCCTSLWFAGNGVMGDLVFNFNLNESALGHLTSSVQFGFISGTLVFALLTIADRFSPSKVFFISALLGAVCNAFIISEHNSFLSLLMLRFFTGFFLAGIYPVGMKIAADYYDKGLGKSLGFLVGALVLGTAFPHLLKDILHSISWKYVLLTTTSLAILGGLVMKQFVPDGHFRKPGKGLDLTAFSKVFKHPQFRSAAFGYFGHMWELYAFWAFVPVMLKHYTQLHPQTSLNIPILSFCVIGIGGFSCVIGGYISQRIGVKKTAYTTLLLSCICCLVSPFIFNVNVEILFIAFLLFWGMVVIADSPMFSTLVAQNAEAEIKGTALTIVNSIGFAITILSIQLLNSLQFVLDSKNIYLLLAIGPILALIALISKRKA